MVQYEVDAVPEVSIRSTWPSRSTSMRTVSVDRVRLGSVTAVPVESQPPAAPWRYTVDPPRSTTSMPRSRFSSSVLTSAAVGEAPGGEVMVAAVENPAVAAPALAYQRAEVSA